MRAGRVPAAEPECPLGPVRNGLEECLLRVGGRAGARAVLRCRGRFALGPAPDRPGWSWPAWRRPRRPSVGWCSRCPLPVSSHILFLAAWLVPMTMVAAGTAVRLPICCRPAAGHCRPALAGGVRSGNPHVRSRCVSRSSGLSWPGAPDRLRSTSVPAKQRAVLAVLLLSAGRPVPTSQIDRRGLAGGPARERPQRGAEVRRRAAPGAGAGPVAPYTRAGDQPAPMPVICCG